SMPFRQYDRRHACPTTTTNSLNLTLKRKDSRMAHLRVLAICVVLLPAAAFAGDWPQFRGPNGTGLADESQVPVEWGPDKNVMWKVKIPGVAWSSPIIWGDKVFVTTAITDKQTKPRPGGGFGPGGFGGPPQPGQIMPPFLTDML